MMHACSSSRLSGHLTHVAVGEYNAMHLLLSQTNRGIRHQRQAPLVLSAGRCSHLQDRESVSMHGVVVAVAVFFQ